MRKIRNNLLPYFSLSAAIVLLVIFHSTSIPAPARSRLVIRVSAETAVKDELVKLGDISQISGSPDDSGRARNISLGYSPNIGMTRQIIRREILLGLSAAGFSETEIALETPAAIYVRRSGQEILAEQIREVIQRSLAAQFSDDQVSERIVRLDLPMSVQVPIGKVDIHVNLGGIRNLFARFSLPVEIRVDGRLVKTVAATTEIEAFAEVLVAVRDLPANAKIAPSDVRLEKRRLEQPIVNYLLDPEKLHGAFLLRRLTSGTEITTDTFAAGVVVKYGDPVRVEARSGELKILLNGEARSAGRIGDRIAVKNLQSGAILQAIVMDEGVVKVNL